MKNLPDPDEKTFQLQRIKYTNTLTVNLLSAIDSPSFIVQPCEDDRSFRDVQCEEKDKEMFNDKFFQWEWRPSNLSKYEIVFVPYSLFHFIEKKHASLSNMGWQHN